MGGSDCYIGCHSCQLPTIAAAIVILVVVVAVVVVIVVVAVVVVVDEVVLGSTANRRTSRQVMPMVCHDLPTST